MAKVPLKTLTSGYFSTQLLNDNFDKIEQAIDNALTRDGTGPNEMLSDLDMNNNEIYNVASPTRESSLATRGYVDNLVAQEPFTREERDLQYANESLDRDTNLQENINIAVNNYQAADANLQAQLTGEVPLEASAFSPISWHDQTIDNSVVIPDNKNAWSFGPTITISSGQSVTVGSGSFWTIANGVQQA
jgi:hypothetical protein